MVDEDQKSRMDRAKWLLGRYPDVTPEEVREVTAILKHSPALDIALLEMNEEVKPVMVRFRNDHRDAFNTGPSPLLVTLVLVAIVLVTGYTLWDFGT